MQQSSVVALSVEVNCTSFAPVIFVRDGKPHAWSRVLSAQTTASLMEGRAARGTSHIIPVHFTFITARRRVRVRSRAAQHRAHVGQRKAAVGRRALQALSLRVAARSTHIRGTLCGTCSSKLALGPCNVPMMVRAGSEGPQKINIHFNKENHMVQYVACYNFNTTMTLIHAHY